MYGTKWSVAGGRERVFDDPACEYIRFSGAVDGNAQADPDTGMSVVTVSPCHLTRIYVLTPVGR